MDRGLKQNALVSKELGLALLFFFALFLFPVFMLLGEGVLTPMGPSVPAGYLLNLVRFTYTQAALSTVLAAALGIPAAFLLFETQSPFRPKLARFSLLCFSLPSLLVVLALLGVWGRSGWWNRLVGPESFLAVDFYGLKAVALANAFFNFPLFLISVGLGLRGLDRRLEFCALAFGASRTKTFFSITLPRLWPDLRAPLVLTFLYSAATSFVVALFLGGGPQASTLEVGIYQALKMSSDPGTAARLSAISIAVSGALFLLMGRVKWRGQGQEWLSEAVAPVYFFRRPAIRTVFSLGMILLFAAIVFAPLISLVAEGVSVLPTLNPGDLFQATLSTLGLAAFVVALTLPLALIVAGSEKRTRSSALARLLNFLPALPLAVSSLVLSVALLVRYPETMSQLRGHWWPIALVQTFSALPLAHRLIREALFKIPDELYVSAKSFGATEAMLFARLELPLLAPALFTAALVTVGISLGEVASVLLFSPGEVSTLAVEVFRSLQRYRFEEGFAYAVVLLALLGSVLGLSTRRAR